MKRVAAIALLSVLLPTPTVARPPTGPVRIEETGRTPDGPLSAEDAAYDSRLRSSMASAQAFQGPMDGGWSLSEGGREIYVFQFTDRNGRLEGAWRDPARPGALEASGFIDQAERTEEGATLRFGARAVALHSDSQGRWTGELTEDGRTTSVALRRSHP